MFLLEKQLPAPDPKPCTSRRKDFHLLFSYCVYNTNRRYTCCKLAQGFLAGGDKLNLSITQGPYWAQNWDRALRSSCSVRSGRRRKMGAMNNAASTCSLTSYLLPKHAWPLFQQQAELLWWPPRTLTAKEQPAHPQGRFFGNEHLYLKAGASSEFIPFATEVQGQHTGVCTTR